MSESKVTNAKAAPAQETTTRRVPPNEKKQPWLTPKMEDVSEEVMAQPYIRFT